MTSAIPETPPEAAVSDHAVVRLLERVFELDIADLRRSLVDSEAVRIAMAITAEPKNYRRGMECRVYHQALDATVVVKRGNIVTVLPASAF